VSLEEVEVCSDSLALIELDRTNDEVHAATTGLVKLIIDMTQDVQRQSNADQCVSQIMNIGEQLKTLLKAANSEIFKLLPIVHNKVLWCFITTK